MTSNGSNDRGSRGGSRRDFLESIGKASAGLVALSGLGSLTALAADKAKKDEQKEPDIFPTEDLMQEHELLNRILLIYDEGRRRLETQEQLDPKALKAAATILRKFVEDYHEKNEETYIFPRFEKAGKLTDIIATLRKQHDVGRKLTQNVIDLSDKSALAKPAQRARLTKTLLVFNKMYRPHESREGSLVFPAFRELLPEKELKEMGEMFEEKEHEILGPAGYEGMVSQVADIEKTLGIYELSRFTPDVP